MGFLVVATPIDWDDSTQHRNYVKEHGIKQFINVFNSVKGLRNDRLMFGDEVEYNIMVVDHEAKTVRLSLRGADVLTKLQDLEKSTSRNDQRDHETCHWVPEYGSWMVEGVPGRPYGGYSSDLLRVEKSMRTRRARLLAALGDNEIAPTVVAFPLLGVGQFTEPAAAPGGDIARSFFIPDECINPHPRFAALTRNIRKRRGGKVDIRIPKFIDVHTNVASKRRDEPPVKQRERAMGQTLRYHKDAPCTAAEATLLDDVYMDAMAFGMGTCCIQVTFQARDVDESRHLYDQLAVMAPIMLALTAGTPVYRGYLVDVDVRWNAIATSVDCRTPDEATRTSPRYVRNSRYGSIDCYICNHLNGNDPARSTELFNDIDVKVDQNAYKMLVEAGIDTILAQHVAHLFIRDPLVIMRERIGIDDSRDTDHWENLQSTNWNSVRWKPPPKIKAVDGPLQDTNGAGSHIGWRTEFRSMEVQLTDFENAAFTVFVVLASRTILLFQLNLYMPISLLDENMRRAHVRDAVRTMKFHWRRHLAPFGEQDCEAEGGTKCCKIHADDLATEQMSLYEVLTGKGSYYPGLVPLIQTFMDSIDMDVQTRARVNKYVDFVVSRASGQLLTPAQWMRNFIMTHSAYKNDSIVSQEIAYDLMIACKEVGEGKRPCPEVLGNVKIEELTKADAFAKYLNEKVAVDPNKFHSLLNRYQRRARAARRRQELEQQLKAKRQKLEALRGEVVELEADVKRLREEVAMSPSVILMDSPDVGTSSAGAAGDSAVPDKLAL